MIVKQWVAKLTQTGTNPPLINVLENSLDGVPVSGYVQPGVYTFTLAGAFPRGKVWASIGGLDGAFDGEGGSIMGIGTGFYRIDDDALALNITGDDGNQRDDLLNGYPVVVRVYS